MENEKDFEDEESKENFNAVSSKFHWVYMKSETIESMKNLCFDLFKPESEYLNKWPKSIKNDYISAYHKYLAFLTDFQAKKNGRSELYIPEISDIDFAEKAIDEAMIARLEGNFRLSKQIE